jgi:hypothetical protein
VPVQHLISSLSVGDSFFLNQCTGQLPTESDDIRCCIDTIRPPEDEQRTARNM